MFLHHSLAKPSPAKPFSLLLLVVLLLLIDRVIAKPLAILPNMEGELLGEVLEVFEETSQPLTISDVRMLADDAYSLYPKQRLSFGYTNTAYWVRLTLVSDETDNYVLLFDQASVDRLEFYQPSEPPIITGDHFPFSTRPLNYRNFAFPISLQAGTEKVIFLRIKSQNILDIPIQVFKETTFNKKAMRDDIWQAMFAAVMLVMTLYHLAIFMISRDQAYAVFGAFIFFVMASQLFLTGVSAQRIYGDSPMLNDQGLLFAFIGTNFTGALFLQIFYANREPRRRYFFVFDWAKYACIFLTVSMFPFFQESTQALVPVNVTVTIFAIITAISYRQQDSLVLLVAWLTMLSATSTATMARVSLIDPSYLDPFYIQAGGVAATFLLGLALATRVERLQSELAKLNVGLQEQVDSQTAELRNQVTKLLDREDALKKAQQLAEQANEFKSQFLARMSHEIRSPMSGILGTLSMLNSESLTENARSFIDQANTAGERLLRIINDILDLTKLEFDHESIVMKPMNLTKTVGQVFSLVFSTETSEEVEPVLHISEKCPEYLVADADRLSQVLFNLLGNAKKFTHKGYVKLDVEWIAEKDQHVDIRFCISDSGIGMEQGQLANVFAEFQQTEEGASYGGSGLGLNISKQLIGMMGGMLEVSSEPAVGSEFEFTLTFERTLPIVAQETEISLQGGGRSILVIEDDPLLGGLLEQQLLQANFRVMVAMNGQSALEMSTQRFDIVISDLRLPDISGFDLVRQLKLIDSFGSTIFLALTADLLDETKHRSLSAGFSKVLHKPFRMENLVDALNDIEPAVAQTELLVDTANYSELRETLGGEQFDQMFNEYAESLKIILSELSLDDPPGKDLLHQLSGRAASFCCVLLARQLLDIEQGKLDFNRETLNRISETLALSIEALKH
jgi:two-component system, sensor histidine kinase LadS